MPDKPSKSVSHNYRHTKGSPPPYRKPPSLLKLIGIICVGFFGAYLAGCGNVSDFNSAPDGKETTHDEISNTIIPAETTVPIDTAGPTFTITPENQITPTITPENQITPTITLQAFIGESCISSTAERVEAVVVRVIDGDTIVVSIDGQEFTVRYIGIDSPENGSNFAIQATDYNTKLLASGVVVLVKDTSETDRYDRLLRYVFADGKFVNAEMVKSGFAESGSWPPDTACDSTFASLEKSSKSAQLGMWVPVVIPKQFVSTSIPMTTTQAAVSGGCPNGCTSSSSTCMIKGNINSDGVKIYHVPGGSYYSKTVISPEKGELWFCTEAEALANGWRRSSR